MKLCTPIILLATLATSSAHAQEFCALTNEFIPDDSPAGVMLPITVDVSPNESIASVELSLNIAHDWVGDLVVTLESPDGTTITILDRPGIPSSGFPGPFGCGGQGVEATFTDSASTPAETSCTPNQFPIIAGDLIPLMPLSVFIGEHASGQWIVKVSDESSYDSGIVLDACLTITTNIDCAPDLTGEGDLNFLDVSAFLSAFANQDPVADFQQDGNYNFLDVSAFLSAFSAGCP
jgi:subtilisin-like proprotein convertase family protein